MNWRNHIDVDPKICRGKARIRGTRIPVSVILDNLAAGRPLDDLLESYPALDESDIRATMAYAAEFSRERVVEFPKRSAS